MKRLLDIICSFLVLLLFFPVFFIISLFIVVDSKGGVFYRQVRVGKGNENFSLYKFRTMAVGADKSGQITIGENDSRITGVGTVLRKYKLDEFPQLLNILKGEMSVIGPRPEVRKYVDMYTKEQLKVLSVKPGLTDYASLEYVNENEILGKAKDPDRVYVDEIMPHKLQLNLKYIEEVGLWTDLTIIYKTIMKIIVR